MSRQIIRMLFLPRERYPTDRVRINVLVGKELLARGHEIDLVMQADTERTPTGAQHWNGRTIWVGRTDSGNSFFSRLRKHWLALWHDLRCLRFARRSRYDCIMMSDKFLVAALGLAVARLRGVKFIYWLTFPEPESQLYRAREGTARYPRLARVRGVLSAWMLYRCILPLSDFVFVQSERMKRDICAYGVRATRMVPIVTGFDLGEISPLQPVAADAGGEARLVYLGTLNADRHLEVLVEMLAILKRDGLRARLILIGDAERRSDRLALEQLAEKLGVGAELQITGSLPQPQALALAATAHIGLSPIFRSPIFDVGSPTKLVEYMALAMPVVANDHPEQQLMLRESRAGVCVPWNPRHFARAARWLMRRSEAERAAMGARGRTWIEANRTYARIADDMEASLLAVLVPSRGSERLTASENQR